MTVNHYEHGYRHDDRRPVVIPQSIDLACVAVWLGFESFEEIGQGRGGDALLQGIEIDDEAWIAKGLRVLEARGIEVSEHRLAFRLPEVLACWSELDDWSSSGLKARPKLHPILSADVPALVIIEFGSLADATMFKMRFC